MLNELNVAFVQELRLGRYSIDFAIVDRKIAIEVDGEYWHRNTQRDARKQDYIIANGWRLIRLPEIEVYNMDGNSLKIKLDESQHTPTVGVGI